MNAAPPAPAFEPRFPGWEEAMRASFARQGAMRLIGAEVGAVEPGFVELCVTYRDDLTQQHGYFHGGVIGALADSACGYAAYTLAPADTSVLTVEYKLNILAPADGERLIARGRVKRAGRTLTVTHGDVFVEKQGVETLCATILQTIMVLPANGSRPAG